MGEEVRDPQRVIPRAIPIALFLTVAIYLAVGLSALLAAGPARLAGATAPLSEAVHAAGAGGIEPVIRLGAIMASLGSLLALIAGVSRTTLAMARDDELPPWLASVHPRYRIPHHAEISLAVVVSLLVATVDLRGAIGFSSFGVLIYYAIANAAAFTQPTYQRRWSRAWNITGLIGCLTLVATLPWQAVIAGTVMFALGLTARALARTHRGRH